MSPRYLVNSIDDDVVNKFSLGTTNLDSFPPENVSFLSTDEHKQHKHGSAYDWDRQAGIDKVKLLLVWIAITLTLIILVLLKLVFPALIPTVPTEVIWAGINCPFAFSGKRAPVYISGTSVCMWYEESSRGLTREDARSQCYRAAQSSSTGLAILWPNPDEIWAQLQQFGTIDGSSAHQMSAHSYWIDGKFNASTSTVKFFNGVTVNANDLPMSKSSTFSEFSASQCLAAAATNESQHGPAISLEQCNQTLLFGYICMTDSRFG